MYHVMSCIMYIYHVMIYIVLKTSGTVFGGLGTVLSSWFLGIIGNSDIMVINKAQFSV